jgi:hypothetical protein
MKARHFEQEACQRSCGRQMLRTAVKKLNLD